MMLCAALLSVPAQAQWSRPGDDDPAIAAARQAVFDASFDEKAAYSEKLLALIGERFGEDSAEYIAELQLHAGNLNWAGRSTEALQVLEQVVALASALHGEDSTAVAFARRDLSSTLRINGFDEQAAVQSQQFVETMLGVAEDCGRVEGIIIKGCSHDVDDVATFVLVYAQLLHDLDRTEEGALQFARMLDRFERRWAQCESDTYGFECADVPAERRAIQSELVRYYKTIGAPEQALALSRDIVMPMLEAVPGCSGEACQPDFRLANYFMTYRDLLGEHRGDGEALAIQRRWLPVLAASDAYAAGAAEDARYSVRSFRESVDGLIDNYAESAAASGLAEDGAVLAAMGRGELFEAQSERQNYANQLALLDTQLNDADYPTRAALNLQKAEIFAERDGLDSEDRANALRDAAFNYRYMERYNDAEPLLREAYAIFRRSFGIDNFRTWSVADLLTGQLLQQDRIDDALEILGEVVLAPENDLTEFYADPIRRATLTRSFSDPYDTLHELGANYVRQKLRRGEADPEVRRIAAQAALGKRAYREAFGFSYRDEERLALEIQDPFAWSNKPKFRDYFELEADARWLAPGREGANAEAFLALQQASMGTTSRAVATAAAERAASNSGAQDLLLQRAELDSQIAELERNPNPLGPAGSPITERLAQDALTRRDARVKLGLPIELDADAERQRDLRQQYDQIAQLRFQRDVLNQEIAAAVPGYFELVRPAALTPEEAQALLGPDEALLLAVPTRFGTHLVLVTREGLRWHRSDLARDTLGEHVRRLLWDVGANVQVGEDEAFKWGNEGDGAFPFDRGTAHLLFRELVAPFAEDLQGKRHLFVAASGSLASLPFGLLVTEEPQGADGNAAQLRATKWLAESFALVQLPSLQSLALLRAVQSDEDDQSGELLLGFGDPVLAGSGESRGGKVSRRRSGSGPVLESSLFAATTGERRLANPDNLRALASLPGTRRELEAMADIFSEDAVRLYLGENATEQSVRNADLGRASIVSFATHGLLAGEIGQGIEPGLVLTPPASASIEDDGLLTASEITALDFNADWVVLSACNTAAGDGTGGAEGFSGLARSFFFAGARSLLASHWPVMDDVAAIVSVRIIELQRANPGWSRAEALQAAMREIREDTRADGIGETWAHPSAWAPFTYVGDVR